MNEITTENRDDEIDVEVIMSKIRENIRRRQAAGELSPVLDSVIISPSKNCPEGESGDSIQRDFSYINSNWDIRNNSYFISSHHPHIGKLLVKGRQMVHGEVRRYVDPMISHQTEFNASNSRIITHASQQNAELNQRLQELEIKFSSFKGESDKKIDTSITTAKSELNSKIELIIKEQISLIDTDIRARTWLAHVLEDRAQKELSQKNMLSTTKENTNYFLFEERFRGSRETIKERQLPFLPYFEKCSRVLDIGCGRGEFLESLRDHNIGGIGLDVDSDMVAYCRSRQLEVEQSDAIFYLERIEDNSLDGIFIDQVVEHLEPAYLIRLLALCYQKLKSEHYIVVETVNPLSLVSFFNFYLDMSHQKPVHPYTLKFLLESSQYRDIELKYYSEIHEIAKLRKINSANFSSEIEQKFLADYNYNIDMLNLLLWGPMDYAVIGKK